MAVINYRGNLPPLNNSTRFTMVMPDLLPEEGKLWRVLWLLNDDGRLSDDLMRRIDVEEISRRTGLVIVMPEGLHSDYENMQRGLRWYDYITQGLPAYIRENFPVSDRREDNFVFGFGMGALGAYRMALRDPRLAAAYGCCGGDMDVLSDDEQHSTPEFVHRMETIYGDGYHRKEIYDLSCPRSLAENAEVIPPMLIAGSGSAEEIAGILRNKGGDVTFLKTEDVSPKGPALEAFLKMIG